MRVAVILLLAGCDAVFGVSPPTAVDAAPPGDALDARPGNGILDPPPPVACGPTPLFESWQFETATFPSAEPVSSFAYYGTGDDVRALAVSASRQELYDINAAGVVTALPVGAPSNAFIQAMSVDPAGDVVWFQQTGVSPGVYYATRASNWVKKVADLGFVDAETVEPGAVGYVDGKARMVITVRPFASDVMLYEIESADGLTWTPLSTVKLGARTFHGHLSPDGCYLLFSTFSSFTEIHVSTRDANGEFSTSTRVVPVPRWTEATRPTLMPGASALWFGCNGDLCRGTP